MENQLNAHRDAYTGAHMQESYTSLSVHMQILPVHAQIYICTHNVIRYMDSSLKMTLLYTLHGKQKETLTYARISQRYYTTHIVT